MIGQAARGLSTIVSEDARDPQTGCIDEAIPLIVDVDGTLVRTDLLIESCLRFLITRPFEIFHAVRWLLDGKARFKLELAERIQIDVTTLPLDEDVFEFVRFEKERGRRIYLASASAGVYVKALAAKIGLFDGVFATVDHDVNLSGHQKAAALVAKFGQKGFDYIGNSAADRPVWHAARRGYAVLTGIFNPTRGAAEQPIEILARRSISMTTILSALRLPHWAKNILLFVAPVLGGAAGDLPTLMKLVFCFVAFGLLASSTYIINDMMDLASDRLHRKKRQRAVASGALPLKAAAGLALVCGASGLAIGAILGLPVLLAFIGYVVATLAYSWRLKRMPIFDACTLAGLYTWRLFVGALVAGVTASSWLMVFSFAFFLSLSFAKRHTEITRMAEQNRTQLTGRGYRTSDAPFVMNIGVATGIGSVIIFVLYLVEGAFRAAVFTAPQILWACPFILLLWLSRLWLLCGRNELHDDPVEFALSDRKSLILAAMLCAAVGLALVS